jgi:phosphohistidine phosphatase
MFCDETGEALNEAAKQLVLDALAADKLSLESNGGVAPPLGPILSSIPTVGAVQECLFY